MIPPSFVLACALPEVRRPLPGQGFVVPAALRSGSARVDASGISQVFRRSILCLCSVPGPRSSRRDLAMSATSMLPPRSGRRRPRRWLISGLTRELRHLLSYASRYRCRHVQSSLPADWLVFAGRESNPLDRYERFQLVLSIILPCCSPDATGFRFAPSGLRLYACSFCSSFRIASPICVVEAAVVPSDLMSAVRRPLASTAAIAASTLSASTPMSKE